MMHTFRFTSGEQDIFRRRPYTPLSVWASENIIVKDGPYAGSRFRLDVNPYLAGIMDTWSDPQVEETDICGSAQTGKTSILHCAIAYCVDMRPGPRMLAMQDDDTISKVMTAKLLPLLKASPAIRGKLGKVRSSYITFHDSTGLFLASAMSPGQRASISIQDLFLDEEALYRALKEGRIAGAACDVFCEEPPTRENPLFSLPNFVGTPHIGANTDDALYTVGITCVEQILDVLEGRKPKYPL